MSDKVSAILPAEEEAEVRKLQKFGGEEIGGTSQDDEGDRSAEADGDESA